MCGRHIITISFSYAKESTLTFLRLECLSTMRRTLSSLLCFINDEKCFSHCKNTSPTSHLSSWTIPNVPRGVLSMSLFFFFQVLQGKIKAGGIQRPYRFIQKTKDTCIPLSAIVKRPTCCLSVCANIFCFFFERWINRTHSHCIF